MTKEATLETVFLKVQFHCQGCQRKLKRTLYTFEGVDTVLIDSKSGKVTVIGFVEPKQIVERLKKAGKQAELWPNAVGKPQNGATAAAATTIEAGTKGKAAISLPVPAVPAAPDETDTLLKDLLQQMTDGAKRDIKKSGKAVGLNMPNVGSRSSDASAPQKGLGSSKNVMDLTPSRKLVMPVALSSSSRVQELSLQYEDDDDIALLFSDEKANNCSIM